MNTAWLPWHLVLDTHAVSFWVLVLAFGTFLYLAVQIIYRLYFHPYAKYPGPLLAKITDLYAAYHAYNEDLHLDILRCHTKYGKWVRYAPDRVLVNSIPGLEELHGHKSNVIKSPTYLPLVPQKGAFTTITAIDKTIHKQKRKVVSQFLSDDTMANYSGQNLKFLDQFCKKLEEGTAPNSWSSPKMMNDLCQDLTTEMASDFLFNEPIGTLESPDYKFVIDMLRTYSWKTNLYIHWPALYASNIDAVVGWLSYFNRESRKFTDWSMEYGQRALNRRAGYFAQVQDAKYAHSGKAFTQQEIWAEGFFLIWAGSETSATTISAMLFFLSRDEHAYGMLAREIRETFAKAEEIQPGPKLHSCQYLSACVNETLRVCPSTSGAAWRQVEPGGMMIDGELMPEGYEVGTSMYAFTHNGQYFADPHTFHPERWIPGSNSYHGDSTSDAGRAYKPFSLGPRACAGKSMALHQIHLTIARIMWQFDFKPAAGPLGQTGTGDPTSKTGRHRVDEYQLKANVTSRGLGPVLVFRSRI